MNKALEFIKDWMNTAPENLKADGTPYFTSIYKLLREVYDPLNKEDCGDSRWWKNTFVTQEINGELIGFKWAETTEDDTPHDKGWEFDESSICFVEPYEVTITKYKKINE